MPVLAEKPSCAGASVRHEIGRNTAAKTTGNPLEIYRTGRESRFGLDIQHIHDATLRAAKVRTISEFDSFLPPEKKAPKAH